MDMAGYLDNLKFQLSGGLLELEIEDSKLEQIINMSLREIQRYINTTKMISIPFHKCIDLSDFKVSSIYRVYRTQGYMGSTTDGSSAVDPLYIAQWQLLGGVGGALTGSEFALNYGAWNSALQIRNTLSTDLNYKYDKVKSLLYVNTAFDNPTNITIEYIPRYDDVSEIVSDYWIDKLCRMSVAYGKIALGRIRTRFNQSNALWTMDGDKLLEEGNTELASLREDLVANANLMIPLD